MRLCTFRLDITLRIIALENLINELLKALSMDVLTKKN